MAHISVYFMFLVVLIASVFAQFDDISTDKRAMRNALVRFGRASGGMRNALVRFGKRSSWTGNNEDDLGAESPLQGKRNGAPQPFVRFGRSGQIDHIHDILSTIQKLQFAGSK